MKSSNKGSVSFSTLSNYMLKNRFIFIFIILVLILGGVLAYKQFIGMKPTKTMVVNKQVLQKRSKDLGYISRGLTGKAIDVNTGKIVKAARVFSDLDRLVYLELDFYTAPQGTLIDYIRYKNGRYVDHGELALPRADTKNILFDWTMNNLFPSIHDGKWKIATYANGILAKRISYEVVSNKVTYVYPDEPVKSTDADYQLAKVLTNN